MSAAGAEVEPIRLLPLGVCIDEPWASGQRKRYLASLDPAFGADQGHAQSGAPDAQPLQPARREPAAERARARAAGRAGSRQRELKGGRQRLRSQAPQRNS